MEDPRHALHDHRHQLCRPRHAFDGRPIDAERTRAERDVARHRLLGLRLVLCGGSDSRRLAPRPHGLEAGLRREPLLLVALHLLDGLRRLSAGNGGGAGAVHPALHPGLGRIPRLPRQRADHRSVVPDGRARHRHLDLQFRPICRGGRLRTDHGLDRPFVQLALGLRPHGKSGFLPSGAVDRLHARAEPASCRRCGRAGPHHQGRCARRHGFEQEDRPAGRLRRLHGSADQSNAGGRVHRPVLHHRTDLLLHHLVPDLSGEGTPHVDHGSRLRRSAAGRARLLRRSPRRHALRCAPCGVVYR